MGGTGDTIGSGGSNGGGGTGGSSEAGSTSGQGGAAGSPSGQGGCNAIAMCNSGQTVDYQQGSVDLYGECPAERECYSLNSGCYTTLCVLPDGVHCNEPVSCESGDTPTTADDQDCSGHPSACYTKMCGHAL